ncbi:hypothetical protein D3Z38_10130 [Clostridiales bacterium]|nr:hypothetical protein [Clostridiales bacterium]
MKKLKKSDGTKPLMKEQTSDKKLVTKSVALDETAQRQMLFKAYKTEGQLFMVETKKFYREAWQLQVFYKEREFIKYAYLDDYRVHNERARGLKTRMDNF